MSQKDADVIKQLEDRPAVVQRNVALGWCPCGVRRDVDCECIGAFRLAAAQGCYPIPDHTVAEGAS